MFIRRARYDDMVRAEERSLFLLARVNQLEKEKADLAFRLTGVPQFAPEISFPQNRSRKQKQPDAVTSPDAGIVSFEDMGDEQARAEGIEWDESGRVKL